MKVFKCSCVECKKGIDVPISSAILFKKVKCPHCRQIYRISEELNPNSKMPMWLATAVGILSTVGMEKDSMLFLPIFITTIVISYFLLRFIMYATGYLKVILTRFYL
ncbi:MAG: hypothetical protein E7191_06710 [Erysipelotrichaceae bacterium]|nr:hypothetical protein [Erysipelotrichaceae bacterium]MBR3693423.1 hypothetical protein [Erysipelotrichales bacterium]